MPGGKRVASSSILAITASRIVSALAPGAWKMPIGGRVLVVELRAQGVVAGAEFDARDVGQAHDLAVGAALEHDVAELLGSCAGGPGH